MMKKMKTMKTKTLYAITTILFLLLTIFYLVTVNITLSIMYGMLTIFASVAWRRER